MRRFLDANVLFTAAISVDGASRAIMDLAGASACTVVSSAYAMDEAVRNIEAKRDRYLADLEALLEWVKRMPEAGPAQLARARAIVHEKDAPILAAAIASGANVLVTGDRRHFGQLYGEKVETLEILPPRQALESILATMASREA